MAEPEVNVFSFTIDDLRELRFENGTRLFAELWETCSVADLRAHATQLNGLELLARPNTHLDPAALLSFCYREFEFFVTASESEYMFYAIDAAAPDSVLMAAAMHLSLIHI